MNSIGAMIKRIAGLADSDLTEFEMDFIPSIIEKTQEGKMTATLSEKQIAVLERIFKKHFGD